MPTIIIPGKDKEEAQRFADEEEKRILKKQHADPDFLLCRHGEKDWGGADPCCAFDEDGAFREHNWNCFLMSKVRSLMGQWTDEDKAPGNYWWDDDQSYGVLLIPSFVNEIDSHLRGCFVLIDWYKSRGKTDSFRILRGDTLRNGTEKDAQELVSLYSVYLDKLYSEDEESSELS